MYQKKIFCKHKLTVFYNNVKNMDEWGTAFVYFILRDLINHQVWSFIS